MAKKGQNPKRKNNRDIKKHKQSCTDTKIVKSLLNESLNTNNNELKKIHDTNIKKKKNKRISQKKISKNEKKDEIYKNVNKNIKEQIKKLNIKDNNKREDINNTGNKSNIENKLSNEKEKEEIVKELKVEDFKEKNNFESKVENSKRKTLMDFIKQKKEGTLLPTLEDNDLINKNNSNNISNQQGKKSSKISKSSKTITVSIKNDNNSINSINTSNNINNNSNLNNNRSEYNKILKPKVVLVNGKIQIEKPDVGLLNKQINDEIFKNSIPLEQDISNKRVTSLSYKKLHHTNKWSTKETENFYKALQIFGLDFSFLEVVLKPRTRFEIRHKYLKEERINHNLIVKSLEIYSKNSSSNQNINKMLAVLENFNREQNLKDSNDNDNNISYESNNKEIEKEIIENYDAIINGINIDNRKFKDINHEIEQIMKNNNKINNIEDVNTLKNINNENNIIKYSNNEKTDKEKQDIEDVNENLEDKEKFTISLKNKKIYSLNSKKKLKYTNNESCKNMNKKEEENKNENKRKKFVDDILKNFN